MNAGREAIERRNTEQHPLPKISVWQLRLFVAYVEFFLRRNFHTVYLLRLHSLEQLKGRPILICLNHPSWWDPLLALYLSQHFFRTRRNYGPIAAVGLEKYKFLERIGLFGIDPNTTAGSTRFVRVGQSVLNCENGALWVTAQGQFTDVRRRPIEFEPGVGYLARHSSGFAMLPMALEYTFWNERYPEAFICFGEPILVGSGREKTAIEWTHAFSRRLEETADSLAQNVMLRPQSAFETLLKGNAGVGGVYDAWRRLKARMTGRPFRPEHGSY